MDLNIKLVDNSQIAVSVPPESSVRELKATVKVYRSDLIDL
jgi:hypothetical protein